LQRFAYLYERQLKPDVADIASIDLQYRNGVAVGWKTQKIEKTAQAAEKAEKVIKTEKVVKRSNRHT
jgi:cell division septal protein FtsQ